MVARPDHYNIGSAIAGPVMRRGYKHVDLGVQPGGVLGRVGGVLPGLLRLARHPAHQQIISPITGPPAVHARDQKTDD
jgi:hypothetical protein